MKKRIDTLIKKWSITLAHRNGQEGMAVRGKPTAAQVAELRQLKPEIMAELKRREAEKEAARAEFLAELEEKKQAYLATADLRRCLACITDEFYNRTWTIETLDFTEQDGGTVAYQPDFRLSDCQGVLKHETSALKAVAGEKGFAYGMAGVAWVITPEQEAQLLAEQAKAVEAAEKEAAEQEKARVEKEAAKEKARQEKFEEAQRTGEPVLLERTSGPCDGSVVECSLDIICRYAMPDGTTKTERHHAH